MRWLVAMLAVAAWLALSVSDGLGARDPGPAAANTGRLEVVVFVVDSCPTCEMFHEFILPLYRASERAKEAPIRFVNVSHANLGKLVLAAPLTMVPTAVVLKEGRELDRITGLTAPDTFMQLVSHILASSD